MHCIAAFIQASGCRTTTTITGIRIRMSASTYANRNADHANSAKNKSITNALVEQSNRRFKSKGREKTQ